MIALAPPVTPANDRPVIGHEDVFEIEVGVRRGGDRLPQRHTRCAPHMERAIGRWYRVLDDALLGNEISQAYGIMTLKRVVRQS